MIIRTKVILVIWGTVYIIKKKNTRLPDQVRQ